MSEGTTSVSAGRRISRVSAVEVAEAQNNLDQLFKKHCEGEDGISETQFVAFCTGSDLIDKGCSASDCGLAFQSVRVGKKTTLNFDRFVVSITVASSCHRRVSHRSPLLPGGMPEGGS